MRDEVLEEVKRRVPLTAVIKPYESNQSANWPYKAICFAHNDHKPSLVFNDRKCRCWACGFTGDLLDVLAYQNGLNVNDRHDFVQVKAMAMELAGMEPPGEKKDAPRKYVKRAHVLTAEERDILRLGKRISHRAKKEDGTEYYATHYVQPSLYGVFTYSDNKDVLAGDSRVKYFDRDSEGMYLGYTYDDPIDVFVKDNQELYNTIVQNKCVEQLVGLDQIRRAIKEPDSSSPMSRAIYAVASEFHISLNDLLNSVGRRMRIVEDIYHRFGGKKKPMEDLALSVIVDNMEDMYYSLQCFLGASSIDEKAAS